MFEIPFKSRVQTDEGTDSNLSCLNLLARESSVRLSGHQHKRPASVKEQGYRDHRNLLTTIFNEHSSNVQSLRAYSVFIYISPIHNRSCLVTRFNLKEILFAEQLVLLNV